MPDDDRLSFYYNRCHPDQPVPADDPDGFYVDFDAIGLRGERCTDAMAPPIQLSSTPTAQLFTGFPGSGKTSELLRLAGHLETSGFTVVYADSMQALDLQNPISYSDVLIALGLAVDAELNQRGAAGKIRSWALRFGAELKDLLFADVTIEKLGLKAGAVDIGLSIKKDPSFRSSVREAANGKRRKFLDQVEQFFSEADAHIRSEGQSKGLVVILDNLEKLSQDEATHTSARNMLLHDVEALRQPGVHLVYTIPASLAFSEWCPLLGRVYDGEPFVLPMVKVLDQSSGEPHPDGVSAMSEMLLRRLDEAEVFGGGTEAVEGIIRFSGGYPRDALRLAQFALESCMTLPIDRDAKDVAIRRLERSYSRGFRSSDSPLLSYIMNERPFSIPDNLRGQLERAMMNHYVMLYGNRRDWYGVHPVIPRFMGDAA